MARAQSDGHLAIPPSGDGSAVLVLHPWWGLNDTIRGVCGQLAEAGYVAFAPDLYHGRIARTIPEAEALSDALDREGAKRDIAESVAYLRERAGTGNRGLAVIGFSLGAFYALDLSIADPDAVRSVVLFYGTRPGDYAGSKAEYLGHYAEADEFEPQVDVDRLEAALRNAGCRVTFHRYPGTGHWFFEPDRTDAFNPAAAALAWERTLAFLKARGEFS